MVHDPESAADARYRPLLLFIDDSRSQLELYRQQTEAEYRVRLAHSYEEAISALSSELPDLVVLDMVMPQVSGLEFLDVLRASPSFAELPVIMVSGENDATVVRNAFLKGASDYVRKPYDAEELLLRIHRLLTQKPRNASPKEMASLERHTAQVMVIKALADLASTRDNETGNHLLRIRHYVNILTLNAARISAFKAQIDADFIESMGLIAVLHDVGKVGIPDHILQKPGALSPEEFAIMKTHATLGGQTIARVQEAFPQYRFLAVAHDIALCHHERWDGGGYPRGLAGEAIPLAARVVSIADVFDALTSKRVYKAAMLFDEAADLVKAGKGSQFDPRLVEVFESSLEEFRKVHQAHGDQPGL